MADSEVKLCRLVSEFTKSKVMGCSRYTLGMDVRLKGQRVKEVDCI